MGQPELVVDLLIKVEEGIEPKQTDYGISQSEFGAIIEDAQDSGLIKGAYVKRAGQFVISFVDGATITVPGMLFINSSRIPLLVDILKKIDSGTEPKPTDANDAKKLWDLAAAAQDYGLIKEAHFKSGGHGNKKIIGFLDKARVTLAGKEFIRKYT